MADFEEPLCGCLSDMCTCLIAWCVPGGICFLQASSVATATQSSAGGGEGMCMPFLCVCCLGCLGGAINRGKIRTQYNIQGSFGMDCILWWCLPLCAATQEYREVQKRSGGK